MWIKDFCLFLCFNQYTLSFYVVTNILYRIEHLPYSMMKLKKLQALWLSENQVY